MDDVEALSNIICDIYDAALNPAIWPRVLEHACGYVQGATATIMSQDSAYKSAQFYFEWGNDPKYLQLYQDIYVKLNPVLVPTLLYANVGDVLSIREKVAPRNRFYTEAVTSPRE